jgi:hypothetical protein
MDSETKRFLKCQIAGGLVAVLGYLGLVKTLDFVAERTAPVAEAILPASQLELDRNISNAKAYRFAKGYDFNGDGKIDEIRVNGEVLDSKSYNSLYREAVRVLEK